MTTSGTQPAAIAAIAAWHAVAASLDPAALANLLDDEVVFHSPALFPAQEGKALTTMYLSAAFVVLGPTVRYLDEWYGSDRAVLEFEADLEGTSVHGVDMIRWNNADRIVDFTVMVRPYRGLEKLMEMMVNQLSS